MRRLALLAVPLLLELACSSEALGPVQSLLAPFPSDILTVDDASSTTGLRVDLSVTTPLIEPALNLGLWKRSDLISGLETRDGFSTFAPIYLLLGAMPAPDSLPADAAASVAPSASLFVVDLGQGPHHGERVPVRATVTQVEDEALGTIQVLQLLPTLPLRPATPYGVAVLRRARDATGQLLAQSDHFAVMSGARELAATSPLAPRVAHGREGVALLVDHLRREGIRPDDVAEGFVFTTQSGTALLTGIWYYLHGTQAPPLEVRWTGAYAPADLPFLPSGLGDLSSVAVVFKGELDVPDVRDHDGGVVVPLRPSSTLRVPFILAMPSTPRAAFPVVMLQHGHGGRKELALYVAPALAARGIATVAIDHMGHGELAATGTFFDILSIARVGGNFVQTIVNGLRLVQALGSITTLEHDGATYALAHDKWIGYIGESLGGISGVGLVATEPEVRAAVFNVAAGGLSTSLAGAYLDILSESKLLLKAGTVALLQLLLDPVDPVNHARALWREPASSRGPAQVLMQNVVGDSLGVETVASLASAIGVSYVCPCPSTVPMPALERVAAPASPPGLFYFAEGKHGFLLADSSNPAASQAVRRQAAHFFDTYFSGGAATIVDPYAP
jgi:hypothetical protein